MLSRIFSRSMASTAALAQNKTMTEKAAEQVQKAANAFKAGMSHPITPSPLLINADGSIGSKFNADGEIGSKANEIGGPFAAVSHSTLLPSPFTFSFL